MVEVSDAVLKKNIDNNHNSLQWASWKYSGINGGFQDPGTKVKIQNYPRDSGTVGDLWYQQVFCQTVVIDAPLQVRNTVALDILTIRIILLLTFISLSCYISSWALPSLVIFLLEPLIPILSLSTSSCFSFSVLINVNFAFVKLLHYLLNSYQLLPSSSALSYSIIAIVSLLTGGLHPKNVVLHFLS